MRIVKFVPLLIVLLFGIAALSYYLPSRDIVRITGTDVVLVDTGGLNGLFYGSTGSGNPERTSGDVRFINAVTPDRDARVYRNQDTGFWPPYFKFDTGSLTAVAESYINDASQEWVAVRHYGWRVEWLSIYPNALSIREVEGPDVTLIPWFNIVFLLALLGLFWALGVRVLRFRRRVTADASEAWDEAGDNLAERRRGIRNWFRGK